jgi:ketosteroid isomerase-like protein
MLFAVLLFASFASAQAKRPASSPKHTPPQSAAQKQQLQDDMEAIQSLHNKDIEASMALDENALESLWTDDIVTMHPGQPPVVGKAANIAKLQAGIEQMKGQEILAYNEEWQEIRIAGDWAYEWGSITGRTHPYNERNEVSYRYNAVRILQRQPDGSWRIARSIYNDAQPAAAPKPEEKPEQKKDENKLKD